jgi:proteic killer suppression protein
VIRSFADSGTEDIFNGRDTKGARKSCPVALWRIGAKKLEMLDSAESLTDLQIPPGNRLEKLKGDREGQHSVRINERYRLCFEWSESGPFAVEIVDYH